MTENKRDAWSRAEEMANECSGGSYIRLINDGDKFVGVFCGEPFGRRMVWVESDKRYVDASLAEPDQLEKGRLAFRASINVFIPNEDRVAVWEMNNRTFQDLVALRAKYGLEKWSYEVTRHGVKGSPKTTYSILPEDQLSVEDRQRVSELELNDLGRGESDDDIPF